MEEKAGIGPDIRLDPEWKKLTSSSYRKGCVQNGSNGVMKTRDTGLCEEAGVGERKAGETDPGYRER